MLHDRPCCCPVENGVVGIVAPPRYFGLASTDDEIEVEEDKDDEDAEAK